MLYRTVGCVVARALDVEVFRSFSEISEKRDSPVGLLQAPVGYLPCGFSTALREVLEVLGGWRLEVAYLEGELGAGVVSVA